MEAGVKSASPLAGEETTPRGGKPTILVIDDEESVCEIVAEMLDDGEYDIIATADPHQGLKLIESRPLEVIITDLMMGEISGVDILNAANRSQPDVVLILMTGQPTIENAVSVVKSGAFEYLVKPFTAEQLKATVEGGLSKQKLERENIKLREIVSLHEICEKMGSTVQLEPLLDFIIETALKEFEADMGAILLYDGKNGQLELKATKGLSPEFVNENRWFSKDNASLWIESSSKPYLYDVNFSAGSQTFFGTARGLVKSAISQPLLARGDFFGVLFLMRTHSLKPFTLGQLASLAILGSKAATAIQSYKLYDDLQETYLATIIALANSIEARDKYTRGHTERVWSFATAIANQLGWPPEKKVELRMGAILHDIGKIAVPDRILNKQGLLTTEEFEVMKRHPVQGARIVEGIPFLEPALPYILYHHERYDGKGYPYGLKGEEVPIQGRLLAVADTLDAVSSDRPYRKGKKFSEAVEEVIRCAQTQFDPSIAEACKSAFN
ncbi:MAG: response regulator [Candidatus Zixiibacteriota bacterium]|nr:MAG: response regulator [candidate division Zixibacteria bacterium]